MVHDTRLEYVSSVKDPIWMRVPLTQVEWRIIQTKAFARLRHIKQMGFVYLSFPGANHNRYEHSIGAMHAAYLLYQMIDSIPLSIDFQVAVRALRISVLLHDIGHPPFSHAVEETFRKYPHLLKVEGKEGKNSKILRGILGDALDYSHENFSRYVLRTNNEIHNIVNSSGLNANEIEKLAAGKSETAGLEPLNALIDGDFDADKIDYIIRDSYYCGLSHKVDLDEFRGKLRYEKTSGKNSYRLFILPEGVPAISSLLLARYKLVKEVQNDEKNRIATQMLIEKLRLLLEDQTPENRAKIIVDMHTKLTDYDFVSILMSYAKGPSINDILDGNLYQQALEFPYMKMHPVVRASSHLLLDSLTSMVDIQNNLRKDFDNENLLLDIRDAKPPKFSTLVRFEDFEGDKKIVSPRNIFDRYYTPHGILVDSFNALSVYIYIPQTDILKISENKLVEIKDASRVAPELYFEYLQTHQSVVARRLVLHAREVRNEKAKKGVIKDIDFLMLVLSAIEEFGRQELCMDNLWVLSDSLLQGFLQSISEICERKRIQIETKFIWDYAQFSTTIFRELELLINMGLVDHMHKLVPHPLNWGFRVDRRISGWGKGYVEVEIGGVHSEVYHCVKDRLMKVKANLIEYLEVEKKCAEYSGTSNISKREPLNEQLREIKKTLQDKKDIVLTR